MRFAEFIHATRSVFTQLYPPRPTFSVEDVPDLTGRVCIVTGGYSGIGKETVKALLMRHAKVYIAGRSETKANPVIQELQQSTGNEAIFLTLDLADLASIRRCAKEFLVKEQELHILFNNAGVLFNPIDQLTADGYDLTFGTNVLGHWYLTELLMPALLKGRETSPDHYARVITTSSIVCYLETVRYNTLKDGPARRKLWRSTLYAQSKFANIQVAREVARRYGDQGILSIAVNPGNIKTDLYRNTHDHIYKIGYFLVDVITLQPIRFGALTQLYAGTMPEALKYNGEFLIPWARLGRARSEAYDVESCKKLWEWLEEQVKTE
ncbi:NAD(P)-binding protein [Irpex lacteus]|nr:NAD(P)-binding protein [Irpex lacteus]